MIQKPMIARQIDSLWLLHPGAAVLRLPRYLAWEYHDGNCSFKKGREILLYILKEGHVYKMVLMYSSAHLSSATVATDAADVHFFWICLVCQPSR